MKTSFKLNLVYAATLLAYGFSSSAVQALTVDNVNDNILFANPTTTSVPNGVISKGGSRFLHNYGVNNTFLGVGVGNFFMTGTDNTGIGFYVLHYNTTGVNNTAHGVNALLNNTTGNANIANGANALFYNTSGFRNAAIGVGSLAYNSTGYYNTAQGHNTLYNITTGSNNTAVGYQAGLNHTGADSNNIELSNLGVAGQSNTIRIGSAQTATYIAGIYNGAAISNGSPVCVDSSGRLATGGCVATGPVGPTGPAGSTGATGPAGVNGLPGAAGIDGLPGATGPAGTNGLPGATGPTGATGPAGTNGNSILNGIIPPTTEGVNGDFYIDRLANKIYGPKANGIWPAGVSLIGPTGATGATGATGPQGAMGPAGATGPQGAMGPAGATGPQGATGPAGATGPQGATGHKSLINTTAIAIGGTCGVSVTGQKIDSGVDTDDNGLLGVSEITNTSTICNGATGLTGSTGPTGATGPAGPSGANVIYLLASVPVSSGIQPVFSVTGSNGQMVDNTNNPNAQALAEFEMPSACTYSGMRVKISGNGFDGSTISLLKNNSATVLVSCTVASGACSSATTVSIVAGDSLSYKISTAATADSGISVSAKCTLP